jgi:Tol biopolymer transport system component
MPRRLLIIFILLALILVACGGDDGENVQPLEELPTMADINAVATENAVTPLPTRPGPTLPPAFTHTPAPTEPSATPTIMPTDLPAGFNTSGTIFYIFNGDSIVALNGDGSFEELIVTFGVDKRIEDLTLSPDGQLLAFVASGAGSGREVYISNRDGTYIQQVSCVGYEVVRLPTWSPDGETIAFVGAQSPNLRLNIYAANWVGSDTCPNGNNQRRVLSIESSRIDGLVFSPDGEKLFFSNPETYAFNLTSGQTSIALTTVIRPEGDYQYAFNPNGSNVLAYAKSDGNLATARRDGIAVVADVSSTNAVVSPITESFGGIQHIAWSHDGAHLLVSTIDGIAAYRISDKTSTSIHVTNLPPQAIYNPADNTIAYVDSDPVNPSIPQIYFITASGDDSRRVTFHEEGTISDMVWAEG